MYPRGLCFWDVLGCRGRAQDHRPGSSEELVTIQSFDLGDCSNGFQMHLGIPDLPAHGIARVFFQTVDGEGTVTLDCYHNSPMAAQLRIERDSDHGLYNDYHFMLNATHMSWTSHATMLLQHYLTERW